MSDISHEIASVARDSAAEKAGLVPGDIIQKINNVKLLDIFDYHYYSDDAEIDLEVLHKDGSVSSCHISKEQSEDLGIIFVNGLMDDYKSCHNKCVFCFIDQMPPGMRETLYFKDDDTRLSFLQGNYVTLTNMKLEDLDRIIEYKLAPINISVHATNPELRVQLLHNKFAGDILEKIGKLYDAGIPMNSQVVLCKGLNDEKELERTISDLFAFHPVMESLSIVPVGLSKYRDNLPKLEGFDRESARATIEIIEKWQRISFEKYGDHFVQASDEFYLLAGLQLPEAERYDGYIQLENGVGMMRLMEEEIRESLFMRKKPLFMKPRRVSIATGLLAGDFIRQMADLVEEKYPKVKAEVFPIRNDFFGEKITVSGLITGQDLIAQLKGKDLGDALLLPCNMLRMGENVFLDDITVDEVAVALQVNVVIVKSSGEEFISSIIGK